MENSASKILNNFKTFGIDACRQDIRLAIANNDFDCLNNLLSDNEFLFEILFNKNIYINTNIILSKKLTRFDAYAKSFVDGKWINNLLVYIENHIQSLSPKDIDHIINFYSQHSYIDISTIFFWTAKANQMANSNLFNFINAFLNSKNYTMLNECVRTYPICKKYVDHLLTERETENNI